MKNIFYVISLFFISMILTSSSVFAQAVASPSVSVSPYLVLVISTGIFVWEHLVAMNGNIKSNSTISLIISMAKQFLGIK